jgi:hypothetical protein
MMSTQTEQPAEERLPYEKPVLRSISLVADEVLGVGCKSISGKASGSLVPPCTATTCAEIGS